MKSVEKIFKLAEQFAKKISLAQMSSAQPSEIALALSNARAKPTSNDIAPLLEIAKVPDSVSLDIKIIVDSKLNVKFMVTANPTNASANILKAILDKKYSGLMTQALQKAGIRVTQTMPVNIATF